MSIITIVQGDDVSLSVTLKKNDATFSINTSATVKAAIILADRSQLITEQTQVSTTAGADWGNSLIIVNFTAALTFPLTYTGYALLEIQVDDSGKTTFFGDILIEAGSFQ